MSQMCQAPGQAARHSGGPQGAHCHLGGTIASRGKARLGEGPPGEGSIDLIRCVDKAEMARQGVCVVGSGPELADKEGTWLQGCMAHSS